MLPLDTEGWPEHFSVMCTSHVMETAYQIISRRQDNWEMYLQTHLAKL